jgi:hypothetical protein
MTTARPAPPERPDHADRAHGGAAVDDADARQESVEDVVVHVVEFRTGDDRATLLLLMNIHGPQEPFLNSVQE